MRTIDVPWRYSRVWDKVPREIADFPYNAGYLKGCRCAKICLIRLDVSIKRRLVTHTDSHRATGNESVPIHLALCWFPGLVIFKAKIKIYFSNKISGVGTMGTGGYIMTCTPCILQVKDAAYVKILSKPL